MKAYLVTVAVLFIAGALANLHDLAVAAISRPPSRGARACVTLLQAVLGAWAVFLLLRRGV